MNNIPFQQTVGRLAAGEDLSCEEMTHAMRDVMSGACDEAQIGSFLTSLANKGETVEEVAGAAAAMRDKMTPIRSSHARLLDTCGTGGGGSTTFNVSTTAALVIAACGVPTAKHGNRSVTSKSGSADVLAALGVNIEANIAQVERCLDQLGLCFCFAPLMHPAMRHVAAVRKKLKTRTIFNLLGPLANPAGASHQLLGVGRPEFRRLIASALGMLGTERSLVVSGRDGLGEVSLSGITDVTQVEPSSEHDFQWRPDDFGLSKAPLDALCVEGPEQSAETIRQILAGRPGPAHDIVVLNASAGLIAFGQVAAPSEGVKQATHAIQSGAANELLKQLIAMSHEPA